MTLALALFILCWQIHTLLTMSSYLLTDICLYCYQHLHCSGFSDTERVSKSSESTDSVSVVGGVLSLIIILIIGVSVLVIIVLLIKIHNLKTMLTQAKE